MGLRRAHTRTLADGRTVQVRQAVTAVSAAPVAATSAPGCAPAVVAADPFATPTRTTGPVPAEVTAGRDVIATKPLRPGTAGAHRSTGSLSTNPQGLAPVGDMLAERFHDDPALLAVFADRFPGADPVVVAHDLVEAVDNAWVDTAVNNPLSDAVQRSIGRVFDPPVPAGPTSGGRDRWSNTTGMHQLSRALGRPDSRDAYNALLDDAAPLIDAYVQTQYAHTQRELSAMGITHLRLYRGLRWDAASGHPAVAMARKRLGANLTADSTETITSNAASSWTLDVHTAEWFAGMGEPWPSDGAQSYGQLVDATVPIESVWSVPATGPGDAREAEAIVIGAAGTVKASWAELDDDVAAPEEDDWWDAGPPEEYLAGGGWADADDGWGSDGGW